jgi:hypothetical protein
MVLNNPGWVANVTCPSACPKPVLLTATSVTQTSILGWTEAECNNMEIYLVPLGSAPPTATTLGVAAYIPYTITKFTSGTAYTFYVDQFVLQRILVSGQRHLLWNITVNDECNATFAIVNQI